MPAALPSGPRLAFARVCLPFQTIYLPSTVHLVRWGVPFSNGEHIQGSFVQTIRVKTPVRPWKPCNKLCEADIRDPKARKIMTGGQTGCRNGQGGDDARAVFLSSLGVLGVWVLEGFLLEVGN